MSANLKRCSKCRRLKDKKLDFSLQTHKRGGRTYRYPSSHCKECKRKSSANYRKRLKIEGRLSAKQSEWDQRRDREHTKRRQRARHRRLRGKSYSRVWNKYRHELEVARTGGVGNRGIFRADVVSSYLENLITTPPPQWPAITPTLYLNGFRFDPHDQRTYLRWKNGESKSIRLATLDHFAIRYEIPFWELEEAGRIAA